MKLVQIVYILQNLLNEFGNYCHGFVD